MPSLITRKARARPCQRPKRSLGFTLIEILVALVILSIGLLGIAALQLRSVQNSQASFERSVATLQARDLVERMWAGICTLYEYDVDGNVIMIGDDPVIDEIGREQIQTAWETDHINTNTFADQGWDADLELPPTGTHVWTITIGWDPRNQRVEGERDVIVHRFMLPPPRDPFQNPNGGSSPRACPPRV